MGIFGWSYPAGAASDPYAPYNDRNDYDEDDETPDALTPQQKRYVTMIRNRLEKATAAKNDRKRDHLLPSFADIWESVAECLPESGRLESEEFGDWQPMRDDDHADDEDGGWRKVSYALDFDRNGEVMEGKRGPCIEARSCDDEGNKDFCSATFEGDPDWPFFYREYISSDDHFRNWCRYHLWCAENGGADPLEEYFSGPQSVDRNLYDALTNLRYLEGKTRGFRKPRTKLYMKAHPVKGGD